MNATLIKALVVLLPAGLLFWGALLQLAKRRSAGSLLQCVGAAGLLVVGLVHICEALQLFPEMGWGLQHSAGHYLDLASAILGFTLFPVGYLIHALRS